MAADRPVESRVLPDLEPALLPLLDGQDAGAKRARGGLPRHLDPQPVSASARCQDRTRRRHQLAIRTGVHRPVFARRRHGSAQGLGPAGLPGARQFHSYRIDRHRQPCLRRRSERAGHRHRDGQPHPARTRLVAAERSTRAGRQALPRLARGRDQGRLLPDREQTLHLAAARPLFGIPARHHVGDRRPDPDHAAELLVPVFRSVHGRRRHARGRHDDGVRLP